jgi:hypothetical protein
VAVEVKSKECVRNAKATTTTKCEHKGLEDTKVSSSHD